jgi:hypothetical protein
MRALAGLSADESTLIIIFVSSWISECLVQGNPPLRIATADAQLRHPATAWASPEPRFQQRQTFALLEEILWEDVLRATTRLASSRVSGPRTLRNASIAFRPPRGRPLGGSRRPLLREGRPPGETRERGCLRPPRKSGSATQGLVKRRACGRCLREREHLSHSMRSLDGQPVGTSHLAIEGSE